MRKKYTVGSGISTWKDGMAQTVTFVVTEDCNLRCKYCYITHKTSEKRMRFETAKKFIDFILSDRIKHAPAIIIEFIGGEPFLEVELVDKICDYFKKKSYEMSHPWYWNYRFSFSTNGVNYGSEEVQTYIKKNYGKISVGITLDGTKEKHDLQRVFPDGSGSYDSIISNIPLYIKQFIPSTKVTFASDDLKYLKDSIINLWNLGIIDVAANVVFEDVWKPEDDQIFENQLMELADYILSNKYYDKCLCSLFDDNIGGYIEEEQLNRTNCGAGKMMAVDADGNIFPCIRYKGYSLNHHPEWTVGNVETGIDMDRVRPFMVNAEKYQSDKECINCPVASGCSHCQGFNYDEAQTETNFYKAKYICKMHKARVRANQYYFTQLYQRYGIVRESNLKRKQIYILLSDNYVSFCEYKNNREKSNMQMKNETLEKCLQYCYKNFCQPIVVYPKDKIKIVSSNLLKLIESVHIMSVDLYEKDRKFPGEVIYVFDETNVNKETELLENCILNVSANYIGILSKLIEKLIGKAKRINVNIQNLSNSFDEVEYKKQLQRIKKDLEENKCSNEINIITDLENLTYHSNCRAGERSFVFAPNGKLYNCVGLYEEHLEEPIGNEDNGINNQLDSHLYSMDYNPICQHCDAYHCKNCIYINKKMTNEVNVSPSIQCRKSVIEQMVVRESKGKIIDPIETVLNKELVSISYYKTR